MNIHTLEPALAGDHHTQHHPRPVRTKKNRKERMSELLRGELSEPLASQLNERTCRLLIHPGGHRGAGGPQSKYIHTYSRNRHLSLTAQLLYVCRHLEGALLPSYGLHRSTPALFSARKYVGINACLFVAIASPFFCGTDGLELER